MFTFISHTYMHILVHRGGWTSRTPAKSYPRQLVPEIWDSRLVPSLGGCLPSRTRYRSYPESRTLFQYYQYFNFFTLQLVWNIIHND